MKNLSAVALIALLISIFVRSTDASQVLWSIGQTDQTSADLALGASHPNLTYAQAFRMDPLFVVGKSTAAHDWPAIQPGENEAWAGSQSHTFSIAFGLKAAVAGTYRLVIDLVDVPLKRASAVVVSVDNKSLPVQKPIPGNGDETFANHPEAGHHQRLVFEFAGEDLRTGLNLITIQTQNGSWMLYDAVHLDAPEGAVPADATGIFVGPVITDDSLTTGPGNALRQTLRFPVYRLGVSTSAPPLPATLNAGDATQHVNLAPGFQLVDFPLPAVQQPAEVQVSLVAGGNTYSSPPAKMRPMRKWTVYLLAHSHHDLGYTDTQPHIIAKQMHNYDLALDDIARCKDFSNGAKYVWNAEVLWSLDDYLKNYPQNQPKIIEAIKNGSVYPNAWYANELTGLCRPEELLRLSTFGLRLRQKTGVPVDSAMMSDVVGMSWGCIQALNEAGVRYLSNGPNQSARIGSAVSATEDKPFYWVSPSGNNKILFWTPWGGYGAQGKIGHLEWPGAGGPLLSHLQKLQNENYPYDMCYIRWSGWGDNAKTDEALAPFVKQWNETHAYPHFVIADTSTTLHALEEKYGKDIPVLKGELTPYWEDGAGSSAHETALNRQAAEQLVQAETLYALLQPGKSPADSFYDAWMKVIMYDEHTWGAGDSIRKPNDPGVIAQWTFKQAFATDASKESRELLDRAVSVQGPGIADHFDVFNTCNWPRTDVVTLSKNASKIGDTVKDETGQVIPSQRLGTGELTFLARDVPPLAARRYSVEPGSAAGKSSSLQAANGQLSNGDLTIRVDPGSGGIAEWHTKDHPENLIDTNKAKLNDYIYALGSGLDHLSYPAVPKITVKESGPVEASLLVESSAPGTNSLRREVKIYNGLSRVDLVDELDKTNVVEAEAGHIAFPLNLPDGQIRLDSQFAVTRPELDQIPGANKNWFTVSRWADVSTPTYGVTLATLDAPLMEVGGITATLARSAGGAWLTKSNPTQTLYSWIFNNHWFTNYKASQSGILSCRYSLQPHHAYDALLATRFGIERSQPLQVFPAAGRALAVSRMTIEPGNLILTAFKSSDDGQALIVRFFNPSDAPVTARMKWSNPQPAEFWRSDMSEEPLQKIDPTITVPAWSLLTVRAK